MNTHLLIRVPVGIFLLFFYINSCFSQMNLPNCNCTVNAGTDKQLCEPGGTVQLNGTTTGNPLSYTWTPNIGLSNPKIKNPFAQVNQTTSYTLTIECLSNTNIVDNANFQQGNTGFTSDYVYEPVNLVPEGLYTITTNPNSVHPGFAPCPDHTGGGGKMMVVNGAGTPGLNVWCQTIPVQPNTDYAFETWVCSVVAGSPALLQFSINGGTIGPIFQAPGSTCQWVQFTATWNSGSSTSATICIVNQNTQLGGNDFALDDISFKEICKFEDEVTVFVNPVQHTDIQASICQGQTYKVGTQSFSNEGTYNIKLKTWKNCDSIVTLDLSVIEVIAVIDPPDNLDCGLTEVVLHGDQSSFGPEYSYKWTTTNGHIVSDPTKWEVIVDKAGTYKLTVTYNDGIIICTQFATVVVGTDYTKPKLNAGKDGQLSCNDTLLTLMGTPIIPNNNYKVNWTTPNGKFVSKTDTLNPTISSPGMYIMQITSNYNGCTAYDTVLVTSDASLPLSKIKGPTVLNCYNNTIWLDGSKSDNGAEYAFQWNTNGGKIDSKVDSLQVMISSAGEYLLSVTEIKTGCKTVSKITVSSDFALPVADAGLTDTLSCQSASLLLTASSNLPDSGSIYKWYTNQGKILSGTDSLSTTIGAPGLYYFKILNKLNGCYTIDSVLIEKDVNLPIVTAGIDDTLNCFLQSATLNATGSSTGPEFNYAWNTINGDITGSTSNISSSADKAGIYIFTVTNQLNGCKATDTMIVVLDIIKPTANAGGDNILTCKTTQLNLDGSQTSSGNLYKYQWITSNGNIISGASTKTPLIDKAGSYVIEVTNAQNGCKELDTVLITEDKMPPDVSVNSTEEITCKSPDIQLSGTNNSPSGSYTYQWSTINGNIKSGDKTLKPLVGKEGIYTLITTNTVNGCTDSDDVIVTNLSELPEVNVGVDTVLSCKNTSIQLSAGVVYKGTDIKINWSSNPNPIQSGGNTLTPTINGPGKYILTVTDTLTGCIGSDELVVGMDTISPKSSIVPAVKLTCKKNTTEVKTAFDNTNWAYAWSTLNGNIISGNTTNDIIVDKTGTYQVIITDSKNGCSSIISTIVGEDKTLPVIDAGPEKMLTCTVDKVKLEGKVTSPITNVSYNWMQNGQVIPGSNLLDPEIKQTGTYVLVVTDDLSGCTNTDSTIVSKDNNVPVSLEAEVLPPGCVLAGSIEVVNISGGSGPYQYSLNGGNYQSQNAFNSLKPGAYTVKIKDINGCELTQDLVIPEPKEFEVELPTDITIEYGTDLQLHPILNIPLSQVETFDWKPLTGLSCSDCMEPFATPVITEEYKLKITDKTGCTASAKVRIFVFKDFGLYIPNVFSPNADGINDIWHVFGDLKKVVKIKELRIYDRWGEQMYEAFDFQVNDAAYGWNGKFRGRYLNPAVFVYYLVAEFVDGSSKVFKGDINLVR